jgi:MscS family membrane protein
MPKKFLLLSLFLFALHSSAFSQLITDSKTEIQIEEGINLSSPYQTTLTFFYNLDKNHFFPKCAARTLDLKGTDSDPEQLAIKLQQIFEGKGIIIRTSEVPNDANFTDSTANGEHKFYFDRTKLPGIFLEKKGGQWKFSSFSVSQIQKLHKETYPYGSDRLLNILPKIGTDEYLGLQLWQLAGITFLIFLTFLAHLIFTFLVDKGLIYSLDRLGYGYIGENYLLPVAKITSFYLIVLLLSLLIRILQLPVEI